MTTAIPSALWERPVYERSPAVLTFALHGLPISQGSKSYVGQSRSGRAIMIESSKQLKPWRALVQKAVEDAIKAATPPSCGFPLVGPIAMDLIFTMRKPKSAPKRTVTYPITKPDTDKLLRAVLDACTYARLWGDDAQVVDAHPYKVYPRETPRSLAEPGLLAAVYTIGAQPASRAEVQLLLTDDATRA